MTKKQKDLLFRDLCSRLPYKTIVRINNGKYLEDIELQPYILDDIEGFEPMPYLRPMSCIYSSGCKYVDDFKSILPYPTGDVFVGPDYFTIFYQLNQLDIPYYWFSEVVDWLKAHYFDHTGLIKKGLALEAPEGMYAP